MLASRKTPQRPAIETRRAAMKPTDSQRPAAPAVAETPLAADTPLEIEALVLAGLRRMTPVEKMARVLDLNRASEAMAAARIRARYGPDLSARELRLRLAALRLDRETMVRVFGWDPEIEGY